MIRRIPGRTLYQETVRAMGRESGKQSAGRRKKGDRDEATAGDHIIVAVGAIIRDKSGRILLVKHRPERQGFWKDKWICPGGELGFGEMIRKGIMREVREEANLEITLIQSLPPFQRIARSGNEPFLHFIYINYLAEIKGGKMKPGGDVGEAVWLTPDEIYQQWGDLHDDTKRPLSLARVI
jgi:ADP-ribose pyrophosphatase YjhB (NUDIX family)